MGEIYHRGLHHWREKNNHITGVFIMGVNKKHNRTAFIIMYIYNYVYRYTYRYTYIYNGLQQQCRVPGVRYVVVMHHL